MLGLELIAKSMFESNVLFHTIMMVFSLIYFTSWLRIRMVMALQVTSNSVSYLAIQITIKPLMFSLGGRFSHSNQLQLIIYCYELVSICQLWSWPFFLKMSNSVQCHLYHSSLEVFFSHQQIKCECIKGWCIYFSSSYCKNC